MTAPDELVGPRVLLRPFALADVPAVLAYASDPEVTRHLQWDAYDDPATAASFIRSTLGGGETWFARAILLRATEAVIGGAGLLVRFGFERLGSTRIQAACAVENERSVKTLERLGMRREGRLAQYRWKAGAARDLYLYAITRADWDGA